MKMTFPHFCKQVRRILFLVLALMAAGPGSATEPLIDQYADGARSGRIFPSSCCWVELPDNERIWKIRRKEFGCSAIGGPVGRFRLEDGKLWMTGLMKCSGDIPLQEIYPDMKSPAFAEWLSGTFKTVLDYRCHAGSQSIYAVSQELVVEKGVVRSLKETANDLSACEARHRPEAKSE
ncbi:hypothetical protein AB4Z32_08770 [Massilia sp. 2TAF26]|uniref:hypothetical protein n=1 Tax=Massilia sp. 2TAF26 TaxID=3233012 RepID=UPI003F9712B0